MSDKRRKISLKDLRLTIIKILQKKPIQAKELRIALDKKGISYSRDRLNDLLNLMMDSGDIERKVIDSNIYPVYSILKKSQLLAEVGGLNFASNFQYAMYHKKHLQNLLDEFQKNHTEKTQVDAMLKYLGFIVMGSVFTSNGLYDNPEQRKAWLEPVLNLEKMWEISKFFDQITTPEIIEKTLSELWDNYPQNMDMLRDVVKTQQKIDKLLNDKPDDAKTYAKILHDKNK